MKLTEVLLRDTRANQPDADAVAPGSLYCVTDESDIIEQSDGSAWNAYSPVPGDFADLGDIPDSLAAVAATSFATGQGIRFTDATHSEAIDITDAAVDLLDDATVSDQRTTLDVYSKSEVDSAIAAGVTGGASDVMIFKGVIDCSANPNYPAADAGAVYKVSVAGKIGGASGVNVEVGDTLYCTTDATASGNQATVGSHWVIVQENIDGAVVGPASVTDSRIALFDGTTGKLIKDGGKLLTDLATLASPTFTGTVTVPSPTNPTDAASKSYVDSAVGGAAVSAIDDIGDVIITTPADADLLTYEASSSKWKNKPASGGSSAEIFDDVTKSANYIIISGDKGKTFVCTGTITLTLPSAADKFWCNIFNNGAGYVTVGTQMILRPGEYVQIVSDGTNFFPLQRSLTTQLGTFERPAFGTLENAADDPMYEAALDTSGTRFASATGWQWRNQGTSSVTVGSGLLKLSPQTNSSFHGVEQAVSGTWKYRCFVNPRLDSGIGTTFTGMYAVDNTSGEIVSISFLNRTAIRTDHWTSSTVANQIAVVSVNDIVDNDAWFEVEYDGTSVLLRASGTGVEGSYSLFTTAAKSTNLSGNAPTHVGLFSYCAGGTAILNASRWHRAA